jgi:hypothetical protein
MTLAEPATYALEDVATPSAARGVGNEDLALFEPDPRE